MGEIIEFVPVLSRLDLVSPSVAACVTQWRGSVAVDELRVAEIDPNFYGGTEFCEHYGFKYSEGANCVVVEAQRGSASTFAAVVVPVGTRTDFNSAVRKRLGARRVSIAQLEIILANTGMEYGSITPVGLPSGWKVLLDDLVAKAPRIVIGSGLKNSKLSLPGSALAELENAEVVQGLARPIA